MKKYFIDIPPIKMKRFVIILEQMHRIGEKIPQYLSK